MAVFPRVSGRETEQRENSLCDSQHLALSNLAQSLGEFKTHLNRWYSSCHKRT